MTARSSSMISIMTVTLGTINARDSYLLPMTNVGIIMQAECVHADYRHACLHVEEFLRIIYMLVQNMKITASQNCPQLKKPK